MITVGHDLFHLVEGVALVKIFLLICFVFVVFYKISFDGTTFTGLSTFEFRNYYLFLFSFLIRL